MSVRIDDGDSRRPPQFASGSLLPAAILALGAFAIGAEGFMIAPLLPSLAAEFQMSVPATAMLVVAFTLALSFSSPISAALTARVNRRATLLLAMSVFTGANLLAACAQSFPQLMGARLLMAIASGLFVPAANALAGGVAGAELRGRALAIVSGGMTIAIALGLPLGALLGHAYGWRATFVGVALLGMIALAGILTGIPRDAGAQAPAAGFRARLAVIGQGRTRSLLGVTLLWSIGAYAAYPYIAPYLIAVLEFNAVEIASTVSLWGFFAAVGVLSGGYLNDRYGSNTVVTASLAALASAFWLLAIAAGLSHPLLPVLTAVGRWGFSVWSFFPAQMARLVAAGAPEQASVSLALNTSTMYLGFAIGSAAGAGLLDTGAIWGIGAFAGTCEMLSMVADRRIGARFRDCPERH